MPVAQTAEEHATAAGRGCAFGRGKPAAKPVGGCQVAGKPTLRQRTQHSARKLDALSEENALTSKFDAIVEKSFVINDLPAHIYLMSNRGKRPRRLPLVCGLAPFVGKWDSRSSALAH